MVARASKWDVTFGVSHNPSAGLVFLSFGFNWVDVGGLLGGRLDEDIVRTPVKASTTRGEVKRAATM